MKIEGNSKVTLGRVDKAKLKKTGGSAFANALGDGFDEVAAPQSAGETFSLQSLLSLQESLELTPADREGVSKGRRLLDDLDGLRDGILLGHFSKDKLGELEQLAAQSRHQASHPDLESILGEIELRAAVELAKIDQLRLLEKRV